MYRTIISRKTFFQSQLNRNSLNTCRSRFKFSGIQIGEIFSATSWVNMAARFSFDGFDEFEYLAGNFQASKGCFENFLFNLPSFGSNFVLE